MKPILIDELVDELVDAPKSQISVVVDGRKLEGWQVAKPINYEKKYMPIKERLTNAFRVFNCKAIPVQYFVDMSEKEQVDYVKSKINSK